jgi:hypothetical protein
VIEEGDRIEIAQRQRKVQAETKVAVAIVVKAAPERIGICVVVGEHDAGKTRGDQRNQHDEEDVDPGRACSGRTARSRRYACITPRAAPRIHPRPRLEQRRLST